MDARRDELHERWARPALMDEVDELREGAAVLRELLELLTEPAELVRDDGRREAICGNLWWAIQGVLWQERLALGERLGLVVAMGALYGAVADAGISESPALDSLTNMVFYSACVDAEGDRETICGHAFEVFSALLESESPLVQCAALEALERIRDPRTRRRLEDARPYFRDQMVRDQAAYVRGALRRLP